MIADSIVARFQEIMDLMDCIRAMFRKVLYLLSSLSGQLLLLLYSCAKHYSTDYGISCNPFLAQDLSKSFPPYFPPLPRTDYLVNELACCSSLWRCQLGKVPRLS